MAKVILIITDQPDGTARARMEIESGLEPSRAFELGLIALAAIRKAQREEES